MSNTKLLDDSRGDIERKLSIFSYLKAIPLRSKIKIKKGDLDSEEVTLVRRGRQMIRVQHGDTSYSLIDCSEVVLP